MERRRTRAHVLLCAVLLGLAAACGRDEPAQADAGASSWASVTTGWTERDGWRATVAANLGEKLGGCALGDVVPDAYGDEIVVVGVSGRVWVVRTLGGSWVADEIGRAGGEMVQVGVGDLAPLLPGLEIVTVGMASGGEDDGGEGSASLWTREGEAWRSQEIVRSPALLHAVAIADLHPAPGSEIVVAGFAREVVLVARLGESLVPAVVATLDAAAKNAVPYRGGVAVGCIDGALVLVRRDGEIWTTAKLHRSEAGIARLATDGERLLLAQDDGALVLVDETGAREVHREGDKLRGAVLANLDATAGGLELATAGYGRRVTILARIGAPDADLRAVTAWEDADRLHHLASGMLTALGGSPSLVACGYSGQVVVVSRVP